MKVFRLSSNHRSDLLNRTFEVGNWVFGFEPIKLKSEDLKLLKVDGSYFHNTYEIKKKIQYRDLASLLDKISKANVCSFKGTNKSKVIKIYIDREVYYTRTKGRLRLKNKKFKTNLDWLKKELLNRGLTDKTPENYK